MIENKKVIAKCTKDCLDIKKGDIVEVEEFGSYKSYIIGITFYLKDCFIELSVYRKDRINKLLDKL